MENNNDFWIINTSSFVPVSWSASSELSSVCRVLFLERGYKINNVNILSSRSVFLKGQYYFPLHKSLWIQWIRFLLSWKNWSCTLQICTVYNVSSISCPRFHSNHFLHIKEAYTTRHKCSKHGIYKHAFSQDLKSGCLKCSIASAKQF